MGITLDFNVESREVIHLLRCDSYLKKLILKVGSLKVEIDEDYYNNLVNTIIGQQLSLKAADTIMRRIKNICGTISPEKLLSVSEEELRAAGTSYAKIAYIKGLSQKILQNEIVLEKLKDLSDQEAVQILTGIKGIGNWTAEMFLIFSLGRLDIFSFDDAGLQKAIKWLYKRENLDKTELKKVSDNWAPYRSIASLYLWEALDQGLVLNPSIDLNHV